MFLLLEKDTLGYAVSRSIETGVVNNDARRLLISVSCILVHTIDAPNAGTAESSAISTYQQVPKV